MFIICCEVPPPNLYFAYVFLRLVWGIPPNLKTANILAIRYCCCVDFAKSEPKGWANEYNPVVSSLNRKPNHKIMQDLCCFSFPISCRVQADMYLPCISQLQSLTGVSETQSQSVQQNLPQIQHAGASQQDTSPQISQQVISTYHKRLCCWIYL